MSSRPDPQYLRRNTNLCGGITSRVLTVIEGGKFVSSSIRGVRHVVRSDGGLTEG